jgi:hypothetical protein
VTRNWLVVLPIRHGVGRVAGAFRPPATTERDVTVSPHQNSGSPDDTERRKGARPLVAGSIPAGSRLTHFTSVGRTPAEMLNEVITGLENVHGAAVLDCAVSDPSRLP